MADIFDEVSEELKHDQLIKTWKKYSKLIIITVLFIIISLVSYKAYLKWNNKKMNYIPGAHYKVARILVKPTAAWMTVWPTPHIMAWVGTMLKLLCLYTKATAAEERTPAHKMHNA